MEFNQPKSGGAFIGSKELVGNVLLVLKVHGKETSYDALSGGDRTIAKVDAVVLDSEGNGELREDSMLSQRYIVDRLAPGDTNTLGRVVQLPAKKPGMNGAIVLEPFEPGDAELAAKWLKKHEDEAVALLAESFGATEV